MLFRAVIFAVLWILVLIGSFPNRDGSPRFPRWSSDVVVVILLGLLGYEAYHATMS